MRPIQRVPVVPLYSKALPSRGGPGTEYTRPQRDARLEGPKVFDIRTPILDPLEVELSRIRRHALRRRALIILLILCVCALAFWVGIALLVLALLGIWARAIAACDT